MEAAVGSDAWKARLASPYAHSRVALDATRGLWLSTYPDEPFDLDMAAAANSGDDQDAAAAEEPADAAHDSRIGYNIVLAAQRQGIFCYDVRPVDSHGLAQCVSCFVVLQMAKL